MSKMNYDGIQRVWKSETNSDSLQDLEDLRLGDMISYLSEVRLSLAHTDAENELQANIFTQEIQNLEFMIRDLLKIRKRKIIASALDGVKPNGLMTISEEELFNRISRGIEAHTSYIENAIAGTISKAKTPTSSLESHETSQDEGEIEYVTVRFLQDVPASVGIDGSTLGPFKAEDIALIPAPNAKNMIHNHMAVRVVSK